VNASRWTAASVLLLTGCYSGVAVGLGDDADSDASQGSDAENSSSGDDSSGGETGESEAAGCDDAPLLPPVIRGLNGRQYARTVEAVFPGIIAATDLFEDSDRSGEFSTNAQIRRLDFKNTADVVAAAKSVAAEAVVPVRQRFVCLEETTPSGACVDSMIEAMSLELYRAPAPPEHRTKLAALFASAQSATDSQEATRVVLQAMLTSPRFLFRSEIGTPREDGSGADLDGFEVASALAYTLTDAPPDAELRAAAQQDALRTRAQIEDQALRLLAQMEDNPVGLVTFVRELTGVRNFGTVSKDPDAYPEFDLQTQAAVLADFDATVGALLASETPTLHHLLTANEFVVSEASARLMGWFSPEQYSEADGLVEVDEEGRRGMLTHPAMLGTYAHELETNPVARGHFISDKLLCIDIPPPPVAVMFPDRDEEGANETLRETLERVHSVDSCAGCHVLMDPYGWPFEVFDAVGRRRDNDRGLPIDDTTEVRVPEGTGTIEGVEQLLEVTAGSEITHGCFGNGVFKYVAGIGRELEGFECISEELAEPFVADGDVREQFVRLLLSRWFLERAIEE
jgi:hypothetical protein